jgi:hypothetical protein
MKLITAVTLAASLVTATGAAALAAPNPAKDDNPPFMCRLVENGGLIGPGCVSGGSGCWLGAWGTNPSTGAVGCQSNDTSTDCCDIEYET